VQQKSTRTGHSEIRDLAESSRSIDHYAAKTPIGCDYLGMFVASRPIGIIARDWRLDYILHHKNALLDVSQIGQNVHELLREETLLFHAGMLEIAKNELGFLKMPMPDYRYSLASNVSQGLLQEIVLNKQTGDLHEVTCVGDGCWRTQDFFNG